MKETTFEFKLDVPVAEREQACEHLVKTVTSLKGVVSVKTHIASDGIDFYVHVSVGNSVEAKQVHNKLTKAVTTAPNVTVRALSTALTDFYDD